MMFLAAWDGGIWGSSGRSLYQIHPAVCIVLFTIVQTSDSHSLRRVPAQPAVYREVL
jgi:hypothetical protein